MRGPIKRGRRQQADAETANDRNCAISFCHDVEIKTACVNQQAGGETRSGADIGDTQHIGCPGRAERDAGNDDHTLANLCKSFFDCNSAGAINHAQEEGDCDVKE